MLCLEANTVTEDITNLQNTGYTLTRSRHNTARERLASPRQAPMPSQCEHFTETRFFASLTCLLSSILRIVHPNHLQSLVWSPDSRSAIHLVQWPQPETRVTCTACQTQKIKNKNKKNTDFIGCCGNYRHAACWFATVWLTTAL